MFQTIKKVSMASDKQEILGKFNDELNHVLRREK